MNKKLTTIILLGLLVLTGCSKEEVKTYDIGIASDSTSDTDPKLQQIQQGIDSLGESISHSSRRATSQNSHISNMERFIRNDYDLIITTSFTMNPALELIADQNPKVKFLAIDTLLDPQRENVAAVRFKSNEASFIAGYMAGLTTKTNMVGYIGFESNILSDYQEYGFKAGLLEAASELNKQVAVQVQYVNTFSDYELGKELAEELYATGIDIIYQSAGYTGLAVNDVAKEFGRFAINYGFDQTHEKNPNVLASLIIDYGGTTSRLVNSIRQGNQEFGNLSLGIKENAFKLSPFNPEGILSQDIYMRVENKMDQLRNSDREIPFDEESFNLYSQ